MLKHNKSQESILDGVEAVARIGTKFGGSAGFVWASQRAEGRNGDEMKTLLLLTPPHVDHVVFYHIERCQFADALSMLLPIVQLESCW